VTKYTLGAVAVLLDSSPFFRFCEGGQVINLARYLGERAYITLEVRDELRLNTPTYRDLKTLQLMRWPPEDNELELPSHLKQELRDILRGIQKPADHPLRHAGEISTVLMGQHRGGELIVLEDKDGKALALKRGVPRLSTAMLAAEMVAVGAITEPEGYGVYDAATPPHVGKSEWAAARARARAAVASAARSSTPVGGAGGGASTSAGGGGGPSASGASGSAAAPGARPGARKNRR